MYLQLDSKRALITHCNSLVAGRAAKFLAAQGAYVVLHDSEYSAARRVADEIYGKGGREFVVAGSLDDQIGVRSVVAKALAAFRGIDILIHCLPPSPVVSRWIEPRDRVSAFGAVVAASTTLTDLLAPTMHQRRWGRIIYVMESSPASEDSALVGQAGLTAYSQHQAERMARHGVTSNSLLVSSWYHSKNGREEGRSMNFSPSPPDLAAEATVSDSISATIAFLASPFGGAINGSHLQLAAYTGGIFSVPPPIPCTTTSQRRKSASKKP